MVIKKCKVCGKEFDAWGRTLTCSPECRKINKRNINKKYNQSDKGKASNKRYIQSDKGKAAQKRYQQSDKGKATQKKANKKYEQSDKGKATRKRYEQSKKGKARLNKYYQNNREEILEYKKEYYKNNKDKISEYQKEYQKEFYKNNKDKILENQNEYNQNKIAELCEQYSGDLEQILKECPNSWMIREAQMRVWFNESYSEGMLAKIKLTPVCEVTGEKTNDLVIHHLYSFNTHPELGNDPANMVRIKTEIHNEFHKVYGYGNNTPDQWMEFVENY